MKGDTGYFLFDGGTETLGEDFGDVPGNSFSFSVRVGCEDDVRCLFCKVGDIGNNVFFFGDDFVMGNKTTFDVDCFLARFGKISYMPNGRTYYETLSEIFGDSFGF